MSCSCCRKPRYKRLVDSLFPEDPQSPTPLSSNMDKLLFFAQASPDHLDRIGEYLTWRLRRSLQREKNGHVCVALKVTEKLLSECDARRLQLMVDSFLDILHLMLETSNTEFQIMATNSFVKFAEREEGNTPYHRQYDFLIHRFASLSLVKNRDNQTKYYETRMAGLKGLRGVIKKIGRHNSHPINIWDLDHMNKIIPSFLFNMHNHRNERTSDTGDIQTEESRPESLGGYSQESLTELVAFAGISHIENVLKPILEHFDLNNLWIEDKEFTAGVYITIVDVMQRQDRYKAVQSLVDHLDAKANNSWVIKQGILDTLSKCVAVAADGSLGPSVLDIFRTLVRHLRISIETTSEGSTDLTSSLTFQQSITKTVGEFAGVLPDYHKPDILGLINSYVPVPGEELTVDVQRMDSNPGSRASDHPLAPPANSPMLCSTLVKCLRAVADTYQPTVLETAFPDHLFKSLVNLFLISAPDTQLDIALLWHRLVDQHGNKKKIPLTTVWKSLDSAGLSLGVVSKRFLSKTGPTLFTNLTVFAKGLSSRPSNTLAFYQLVFLLTLEFSTQGLGDVIFFLNQLQELATSGSSDHTHWRVVLHVTVAGVLYLVSKISHNESLRSHVDEVIARRREKTPSLLPDTFFSCVEDMDGVAGKVDVTTEETESLQVLGDDESVLFKVSEVELNRQSPAPSSGSITGPMSRDSVPELTNHFSVSLDYGPDSPLQADPISFNNLKERVEIIISDEQGGGGSQPGHQGAPSGDFVFYGTPQNPEVSFEAMVGQSSRRDDSAGLTELAEILNTSVPHSSPMSIPGTHDTSNAYDLELPTLH